MQTICGVPIGLTTDGKIVVFDSMAEFKALPLEELRKNKIDQIFASTGDLTRKIEEIEKED